MKSWKRVLAAGSSVLTLLVGCLTAFAVQEEIPELHMEVQCPDGWAVLKRSVEENDPNLSRLGVSREEVLELFESSGIYLNAINMETYSEIVVTMADNDTSQRIYDLSLLSEQELKEMAEDLLHTDFSEVTGMDGIHYDSYAAVEHPQATFLEYRGGINNEYQDTAVLQDFTIINGQHINITLRNYSGTVTAQEEEQFRQMVASIRFTTVMEKPASGGLSAPAILSIAVVVILMILFFAIGIIVRCKKKREALSASADAVANSVGQTSGEVSEDREEKQ